MMHLSHLVLASLLLCWALTLTLMDFRGNFFGSLVEISSSNLNILIFLTIAFYYILLVGIIVQKLWFGPLWTVEVEHLYERSWFAVMVFTLFYPRILVWPWPFSEKDLICSLFFDLLLFYSPKYFIGLLEIAWNSWIKQSQVDNFTWKWFR